MSSEPTGFTFDNAYLALDEIFAGHPLRPAVFTAYLTGTMFSRIADSASFGDIRSDPDLQARRFRDFPDQSKLFWAMFNEIYQMDVIEYRNIISDLWQTFKDLLDQTQQSRNGKDLKPQFYQAAHKALIRDYRYFGDNETARHLEQRGLAETSERKGAELEADINELVQNLDPKNDKSGYRLARRLCNKERPLFLKFLCNSIQGSDWWIEMQKGFDNVQFNLGIPAKYRLFCRHDEIKFCEKLFQKNSSGASAGGQQGNVIGNKFLHSKAGRALLGAISKSMEAESQHDEDVEHFLLVAFYNDWDEWLSKYIGDMIHHETPEVQAKPERRVVGNYSQHFANTGNFSKDQPLSNRVLRFMQELNHQINKWPDAGVLEKDALEAIGDNQTGSGRSGNPNTRKVPRKVRRDVVTVERTVPGVNPLSHFDETHVGGLYADPGYIGTGIRASEFAQVNY